jgi:hypothetical protein
MPLDAAVSVDDSGENLRPTEVDTDYPFTHALRIT